MTHTSRSSGAIWTDCNAFVLHFAKRTLRRAGRGLSFFFLPAPTATTGHARPLRGGPRVRVRPAR